MTHTLHRFSQHEERSEEFVLLSMAAQEFNDKGAAEKLLKVLDIVISEDPSNVADDAQGGIFTGKTIDKIKEEINDKAYIGAAFPTREQIESVLIKLKEADIGMSVVVTGNFKEVFDITEKVGLKPNAVNISLGIFGNRELLPNDTILEIVTMCGHGMVSPDSVEYVLSRVKRGLISPDEGAKELARPCTCGIFNVDRVSKILSRECGNGKGVEM